ncbi:M15 family metallopeptidase [Neobacillus niacini]|uniref:M15 family metallopeptidase n=1 Tax=Neobacillus niacini TaxID=86668 RepID=UPI003983CABE
MKKWGFLLLLAVGMGITIADRLETFKDSIEIKHIEPDYRLDEGTHLVGIGDELVYQGNLLLVNKEHPVHEESIKSDVVNLMENKELTEGYGLLDSEIYLSEEVAYEFSKLVNAAEDEGVRYFSVNSGFRDFNEQNVLYQQMGASLALPAGHSEHNLGLSLDVGSTQMKMSDAPEGKWIEKNAWKYGFILRYPKDKTHITGIQYEPWHIRYVGLPHSAIIEEKDFALEEYIDYLRKEKNISAIVNGQEYTITFYPIETSSAIKVSKNSVYEISGNNIDGVIVTELKS